ncbi:MAG: thioesterase [Nibricoccus sp.]
MSNEHILTAVVPFADVDRNQIMLLPRLFKLLQEAAIQHAELYGVGARGVEERGTSWVLNRIAVELTRYPRRDESLRLTTWSTGVHGFRGYREFRLYAGEELLLSASSLWLWIDLRTRTLTRVPEAIAHTFPVGSGSPPYRPDLEKLRIAPPGASATSTTVDLRYSDQDSNSHINNTAYIDLLQTALLRHGLSPQPLRVEIQFQREIPIDATTVEVRLEPREAGVTAFSIANSTTSFAQGLVS